MSNVSNSEACRFLDLPPEIRDRIYCLIFLDENEDEIDFHEARSRLPKVTITLTCRQVRREALGLIQEADEVFYQNHCFLIDISKFDPSARLKGHYMREITKALPWTCKVRRLAFVLDHTISGIDLMKVGVRFTGDNALEWTPLLAPTNNQPARLTHDFQSQMATQLRNESRKLFAWIKTKNQGINVSARVELALITFVTMLL